MNSLCSLPPAHRSLSQEAEAAGKPPPVTINMGLDPAIYIGACFRESANHAIRLQRAWRRRGITPATGGTGTGVAVKRIARAGKSSSRANCFPACA